jgi:HAMP domain-containing protein/HPt (histidine-containing phosphotransfer) domain-containing protein
MKKSIWVSILLYVVIPFLVIYLTLSATLIRRAYLSQIRRAERDLASLGQYYEFNFKNFYESAELSVQMSAAELEMLDGDDPEARLKGADILTGRFQNTQVLHAWLVFEPDAFDGRDALHTGDYPGAPSGRYIRSFNRRGNSWETAGDIDETTLDDWDTAYWYIVSRNTGAVFTDLGEYDLIREYGGGKPASSIGVIAPVFRNGRIIGCVGLDFEINEEILGKQFFLDAETAVFLSDGRLGYSMNTGNVGKSLEALGFDKVPQIRQAMAKRDPLFLYNEYSGISRTKSLNYFYPTEIAGRFLYIYIAIPQSYVWQNILPVLTPIGISICSSLIMFSLLLLYLFRGISKPIQKLTRTSEAIAAGELDVHIEYNLSGDELGMITRSLSRMVEQFRASKLLQQRYQDRFDIIMGIHYALFHSVSPVAAFNNALKVVAEYFHVFKAILVFIMEESPRIAAVYPPADSREGDSEFFSHKQIVKLIGTKKHLTMNYGALSTMHLSFLDFAAKSLCILPLRVNETLKGYIILEGAESGTFVHDDTTLLFIGDVLAYLLDCRADWTTGGVQAVPGEAAATPVETAAASGGTVPEEAAETEEPAFVPPENTDLFLEKAKTIRNLDVNKGLLLIGGEKEQYTELLLITNRVIGEEVQKMRALYTENLAEFGIEVHGMKSALYSIGAELLGDQAQKLEFAAKSGDAAYCREMYPDFEEKLRTLSRNLASLFPRRERSSQTGDPGELEAVLEKVLEACSVFDNSGAQSLLAGVSGLKWEDERTGEGIGAIGDDLENLEYEKAAEKIRDLLQYLESGRE